ncbi:hypothetical protein DEO72_LG11g1035 [Vigna unguiculata]|uniref:Uncharacterized protein n=1 Tax=Vigna unguiculata TaxID=3917 RepID=A0A4D6NQF3_VIGUN|nr:hypothetical protein DEO72_LG11g1035 [Vigna unguiculata]
MKTRICVVFWCEAEPQNSRLSLENVRGSALSASPAVPQRWDPCRLSLENVRGSALSASPAVPQRWDPCRSGTKF